MGSDASGESHCDQPGVTRDAQPVHRVYVDGFWMDRTEVTNAQFAAFVQATGYRTVAEIAPTKEEFPGAPPGQPDRRVDGVHADGGAGRARRLVPVVALCAGCALAPPAAPGVLRLGSTWTVTATAGGSGQRGMRTGAAGDPRRPRRARRTDRGG